MITSQEVKEMARSLGADLVGIGSMDRFDGTPPRKDPRFIAPRAKSIIGLGFRVLRGSLRGIEEGTQFYQFPEMGVVNIDETYAPVVLRRLACWLEDRGHEGVVQRSVPDRQHAENLGTNIERTPPFRIGHADPVKPDRPAPDVLMDFVQAAYLCGMGEIGLGGFFLTPRFGPLQRFAFILTDAELAPDPLVVPQTVCDSCGACVKACPGRAIDPGAPETRQFGGVSITHATLHEWQCAAFYAGADPATNPFCPDEKANAMPDARTRQTEPEVLALYHELYGMYPPVRFGYHASLCGRACWRACLAHLEEIGVLETEFFRPFRTEAPWHIGRPA